MSGAGRAMKSTASWDTMIWPGPPSAEACSGRRHHAREREIEIGKGDRQHLRDLRQELGMAAVAGLDLLDRGLRDADSVAELRLRPAQLLALAPDDLAGFHGVLPKNSTRATARTITAVMT